ncbi:MAG: hypothetical protein WD646_15470 [Actinomycetota bacterium]
MRRLTVLGAALVMLTVLAACGREAPVEQVAAGPAQVTVVATDYKLAGPASVGAGAVSLSIRNDGMEAHQAALFKLNAGADVAQMIEAAKAPDRNFQKLGAYSSGPLASPGGTEEIVVDLDPGQYAFFCEIPDSAGTPHLALGMAAPLEVTDAAAADRPEPPTVDQAASGTEMSFVLPTEWTGTIGFENKGQQPHELVIGGAAEGKTIDEAITAITAAPGTEQPAGPPAFTLLGGVSPIRSGKTAWFEVDLAPGPYFALCFVGDPAQMAPHFALGMLQKFEVK